MAAVHIDRIQDFSLFQVFSSILDFYIVLSYILYYYIHIGFNGTLI